MIVFIPMQDSVDSTVMSSLTQVNEILNGCCGDGAGAGGLSEEKFKSSIFGLIGKWNQLLLNIKNKQQQLIYVGFGCALLRGYLFILLNYMYCTHITFNGSGWLALRKCLTFAILQIVHALLVVPTIKCTSNHSVHSHLSLSY